MKKYNCKNLIPLIGLIILILTGCSSTPKVAGKVTDEQIANPPQAAPEGDKNLFLRALGAQNKGQFEAAVKLWKQFLSKYPKSHEAHNNLGMVYYTQDQLTPALEEFETAYRLMPEDETIRVNLAKALELKANIFHENREYYKTLEVLARLLEVVPEYDKQKIMFKQEQVEDQIFIQVMETNTGDAYHDFIKRFPDGLNAVRAQAILDDNPDMKPTQVVKKKKRTKKSEPAGKPTNVKSWLSGSTKKTPEEEPAAQNSATFSPPAPSEDTEKKKKKDIFGLDPEAAEEIEEEDVTAAQASPPAPEVPFEDPSKPVRAGNDTPDTSASPEQRPASASSEPGRSDPSATAASLETSADLEPTQATAIPTEIATAQPAEPPATAVTAPAPAQPEQDMPAPQAVNVEKTVQTGPAAAPAPSKESEESESERIARIIREEMAKEEQAKNASQPTSAPAPAPAEPPPVEEPAPETPAVQAQMSAPPAAEPTPAAPSEPDQVVALPPIPKPAPAAAPAPVKQPGSVTMVVITVAEGSTLNVRSQPSTKGEVLGYLERDDMMPLISESGDWYEVGIDESTTGWVHKKFAVTQDVLTQEAALDLPAAEPSTEEELAAVDLPTGAPAEENPPMVVIQVKEGSALNVRSIPSSSGEVVAKLAAGESVPLADKQDGWYQVELMTGEKGWVSSKFSSIEMGSLPPEMTASAAPEETTAPPAPAAPVTTVVVIKVSKGSSLNVRSRPSSSSSVMGSLKSGDMRPLMQESGDWYQIEMPDGSKGWVSSKFSGKMDLSSNFIPVP